ncbi:MAG: hypothetical protein KC493_06500 [Bacteriovoracaceae bacterium]|nr:hypothetical protein [Bacteriovoracaceae bacterium]
MKKLIVLITLLASVSAMSNPNIEITIVGDSDLTGTAGGRYLAKKDSFFCREFSMNDGSPTRIQKVRYKYYSAENGIVDVPGKIKSRCMYERIGGASLAFEIKGKAEPYNVVSVFQGGGDDLEEQIVKCKQIISGPSGKKRKMIRCYGDIRTDSEGRAVVTVIKQ